MEIILICTLNKNSITCVMQKTPQSVHFIIPIMLLLFLKKEAPHPFSTSIHCRLAKNSFEKMMTIKEYNLAVFIYPHPLQSLYGQDVQSSLKRL